MYLLYIQKTKSIVKVTFEMKAPIHTLNVYRNIAVLYSKGIAEIVFLKVVK